MSALRQRLIEDMQVRNYSPRTVEAYVAAVAKVAKHFLRAPDQLTSEELRAFQVHLLRVKRSWSQFNQIVCGLRFFYGTTLGRSEAVETLPYGKRPKVLPVVLSMEEVAQLLAAAKPGRERMLLETAYGCGLLTYAGCRTSKQTASENAHFRWALPILAPPEPSFLPADS